KQSIIYLDTCRLEPSGGSGAGATFVMISPANFRCLRNSGERHRRATFGGEAMVAFGRRSTSDYPRYDSFDSDEIFAFDEMTPGERVCPPPHRSRMAAALRSILFLLIAVGVGWVLMADRTAWPEWLNVVLDHSTGLIDRAQSQLNENATRVA